MSANNEMEAFFNEKGAPEIDRFVEKNLQITEQIFQYLRDLGWSQKDLAQALGVSVTKINKWLSGMHNISLKNLTRLEVVLNAEIIMTPQSDSQH